MKIWIVHAFTDRIFSGNPAAVVPLERWLPDATLQAIAAENNLSETAFLAPTGLRGNFQLRWFTPLTEVPLCGHATLAAGAILLSEIDPGLEVVVFDTHAGALIVRHTPEGYTLDLPRRQRTPWEPPQELARALGVAEFTDAFTGEYACVVLEDEKALKKIKPDVAAINQIIRGPRQGCLIVTAPGDEGKPYDFVSRFFGPGVGIDEDPVTGSAFADVAPYWCDRFDMESVVGFQASKRGGYVRAIQTLSSVRLLGQVAVYLRGELDPSIARLANRTEEPEAPRRKKRRAKRALPAIFEDPLLPGLEAAPPPTSHPAPPETQGPPPPRIMVTGGK
ncbi:MAG: PhzF family phenazine biosynthesis protein [Hyphomonadaceae bacterium]|nr:PhzF family phenazine biosynthesis protein [Hyphomonadaceae bacterium]MBX3509934.1 PhzF family phenazine biosynthesis protein [Hyphomonadaceae bacterium]